VQRDWHRLTAVGAFVLPSAASAREMRSNSVRGDKDIPGPDGRQHGMNMLPRAHPRMRRYAGDAKRRILFSV
jgi:hypothetical protein